MNQPYTPAEHILLVHKTMVDEELQRHRPERHRGLRDIDRPGVVTTIRRVAARGLVAVGTRLDPTAGVPESALSGLQRA